jgi:hypothetical protein
MPEFYYQIKGLEFDEEKRSYSSKWSWPPLFSGKVEAANKKEAREKINAVFEQQFPCRVKSDDFSKPFLLHVEEIGDNTYLQELFVERICEQCGCKFRRIDLYNDVVERYKGKEFCSQSCKDAAYAAEKLVNSSDPYGNSVVPCIYKITNRKTGKCYIGQTRRQFTLRWWEHFKWGTTDSKFHSALKKSNITDWTFEVVETCSIDELDAREAHYICEYDSIHNGYNTAGGKGIEAMRQPAL